MDKLFEIKQGPKTPLIELNSETGTFSLKGKSVPDNSVVFYAPVFAWLDEYLVTPAKTTSLDINLDYFNTSSAKLLADLFNKLEALQKSKKSEVAVNWSYAEEDEDMLEAGEDYKSIFDIPFNLIR